MEVRLAKTASELAFHEVSWSELARHSADRNPFYESWMLLPAMEYLSANGVQVAFVYEGERLYGVFPLCCRSVSALALRATALWRHEHCALAQPLVRAGRECEVMRAFLSWWDRAGEQRYLLFDFLDKESTIAAAIATTLLDQRRSVFELDSFSRAAFRPTPAVEEYLKQRLPRHRRKEFSRLRKRWEELGVLQFVVFNIQDSDPVAASELQVEQWVQQFILLEQAGWKGAEGGALGKRQAEESYFRAIVKGAYVRRALLLMHLEFEGKPVAMKCDIISDSSIFAYKIAYDEQYAKFSPGVLLELDHMRYFENRPQVTYLDSCAVSIHPMIDRLWQERRNIVSLLTHRKGMVEQFVVGSVLPNLRYVRQLERFTKRSSRAAKPRPEIKSS